MLYFPSQAPTGWRLSHNSLSTLLTAASSQSQSYLITDGHSASLSWYETTISDQWQIFLSLPWKLFSDTCDFYIFSPPIWREDGSVIYSWCWFSPAQSFSILINAGLTWLISLNFESPLNLEGQVPVFTSPRKVVAEKYRATLSYTAISKLPLDRRPENITFGSSVVASQRYRSYRIENIMALFLFMCCLKRPD
jgi:hypothetical protein